MTNSNSPSFHAHAYTIPRVSVCTYYLSKESYISITQSGSSRNGGRAGHTSLCYHRAATHEATRVIYRLWLVQVLSFMKSFSWLLHCLCRISKTRSRLVSITTLVAIIHFHNSGSRQSSVWNAYLSSFPWPAKVQQWKKRPGQVASLNKKHSTSKIMACLYTHTLLW